MTRTHVLGFPRIGARRELKFALEAFWRGESGEDLLHETARALIMAHWDLQQDAGLDFIAAGDFSFYDHVLDTSLMLGAPPRRFGFDAASLTRAQYFELARGNPAQPALEMTKWFDTNYHYLVPELERGMAFEVRGGDLLRWMAEAIARGPQVKPVLVGPMTYLWLSKMSDARADRLSLLPPLLEAYVEVLTQLARAGVEWVQLDEPALCVDPGAQWIAAFETAYQALSACGPKILVATYFDSASDHAGRLVKTGVHGWHLDLVRAPDQLDGWLRLLPADAVLSAGIVDGRNVWRTDLRAAIERLRPAHDVLHDRLWIAPSCSLLHVPVSLAHENNLDPEVRPWLAFATEKLDEVATIARALDHGTERVADPLAASDEAQRARKASKRIVNEAVRSALAVHASASVERRSPFGVRAAKQRAALDLPLLPTTTIGSFPQDRSVRAARAAYRRGELGALAYLQRMRREIESVVRRQEALGLDVLVHGEAERTDMVEYFAEHLWGYAVTDNGWVQSYGSRCVKPPILYGDVSRPEPITVETISYAQSLTMKIMKGMLTGPVTMLQWSFVRDDARREQVAMQIALAIREEVADLERAGIRVIQIDEPALREGLPLRRADWDTYLAWAVRAFKLSASVVADETQIHTHMCYSEFGDILPAICALDADVITIETSRSKMELLDAFAAFDYPNGIGPGVFDIHSPRVVGSDDMLALLERAARVIAPERLWVNPDCGLKTRGWAETEASLANMVEAASRLRERLMAPA
ncbi:MAG TPA: 5-methyltetrahydropteroyltriglutamate--homocysteine S-methyltransferase [Burkholderiales bacterium]|nr:5-methyltetrahydropteroyltriglutamate--homocysteine S-methyltransferase [Burkholderiales bacterium]